ncbi:hypothetical protein HN451_07075, partial [archaeon]|nr:hypothetical protein [archaeon]
LKRDVKLNYYAKEDYNKFYSFLILYNVAIHTGSNIEKIKKYFQEFEIIYDKIIFNNLALVSESIKTKKAICQIITMEELKIQYFKKIYMNKISKFEFDKKFGHYGLNPYELSEKRFEEYSKKELMKLASLSKNFELNKNIKLDDYIKKKKKDNFSILVGLRELGKYKALLIIKEIRNILLNIEKEKNINNIFSLNYNEIDSLY